MSFKKVVVAGGGVLGSQIAFQAAYCGFDVTIWLRSQGSIGRTQPKLDNLKKTYEEAIESMATGTGPWCAGIANSDAPLDKDACLARVRAAYESLKLELDMTAAVADADLVIESMAEDSKAKIEFYQKMAPLLPAKTVIATNSSTLLPSQFAKYTGRPDKYLSLHFANSIWKNNTAEVMGQAQTSPAVFDQLVEFANQIRMIALPVRKEKNGYLLNSMLVPFLLSGLDLWASGVSDPKEHRHRLDARHRRPQGSVPDHRHGGPGHGAQHRQPVPERAGAALSPAQEDDDALQLQDHVQAPPGHAGQGREVLRVATPADAIPQGPAAPRTRRGLPSLHPLHTSDACWTSQKFVWVHF